MKKLIVFDLDGTLAVSKSPIDDEMMALLHDLLSFVKVAVISGGDWPQFNKQVVSRFPIDEYLANLFILPTSGTKFYRYGKDGWEKIYSEDLAPEEKTKIVVSLKRAVEDSNFNIKKVWGETIEDRGSQITFSALGQEAPFGEKKRLGPGFRQTRETESVAGQAHPGVLGAPGRHHVRGYHETRH